MRRIEFSKKTKVLAFERAKGRCENLETSSQFESPCGAKLYPGNCEFDHVIPAELGGDSSLSNCQVLCRNHHKNKTRKDQANIGRARRVHAKHLGIKKPRSITGWKNFRGEPIRASRER